jgi:hypothetical protein
MQTKSDIWRKVILHNLKRWGITIIRWAFVVGGLLCLAAIYNGICLTRCGYFTQHEHDLAEQVGMADFDTSISVRCTPALAQEHLRTLIQVATQSEQSMVLAKNDIQKQRSDARNFYVIILAALTALIFSSDTRVALASSLHSMDSISNPLISISGMR